MARPALLHRSNLALLAVLGSWLAGVVAVAPTDELPLFDDWVYAWSARHLAAGGGFEIPEWSSVYPVFQVAWGGLFAWLLGPHQWALRLSTLTLALVGNLCWYRTVVGVGLGARGAAWAVAAIVCNPVYFLLSMTFMTDVVMLSLWQIGLYLALPWTRTRSWWWLAAATATATASALVRQPGAALLVGLAAAALRAGRPLQAALPLACAAGVLAALGQFGHELGGRLPLTGRLADAARMLAVSPALYVQGVAAALAFVGLCAGPVAVATARLDRRFGRALAAALACLSVVWLAWGTPVLGTGTMWAACELGGASSLLAGGPTACAWQTPARLLAVVLAATGLAGLAVAPGSRLRRGGAREPLSVLVAASFAVLGAGMVALWLFADRYWLAPALLAPALLLAAGVRRPLAGGVVLAAYLGVAVAGSHGVLSLYRAVAAAADGLAAGGVPAAAIDAGYALNGERRYLAMPAAAGRQGRNRGIGWVTGLEAAPYTIAGAVEPGWRSLQERGGVLVVGLEAR